MLFSYLLLGKINNFKYLLFFIVSVQEMETWAPFSYGLIHVLSAPGDVIPSVKSREIQHLFYKVHFLMKTDTALQNRMGDECQRNFPTMS